MQLIKKSGHCYSNRECSNIKGNNLSTTRLNAKIASSTAVHASIINIVLADKSLVFCSLMNEELFF